MKFFSLSKRLVFCAFSSTLITIVSFAHAEEPYHEQHVHVHGEAQFTLVVDRNAIVVDFDSPAMNIVGFEHAASGEADRQKILDAVKILEISDNVIQFSASAQCKQIHSSVSSGLIAQLSSVSTRINRLKPDSLEKGHTAFEVGYQIECKYPEKIKDAEFPVFTRFEGLKQLHGQWVVGDVQGADTFSINKERIDF